MLNSTFNLKENRGGQQTGICIQKEMVCSESCFTWAESRRYAYESQDAEEGALGLTGREAPRLDQDPEVIRIGNRPKF